MFETSVVRERVQASGARASLFTISVFAHTAVIVGVIAASIATVDFPATAPDEYALAPAPFVARIPPPLGNPDGGAKAAAPAQPKASSTPVMPKEPVAPSTIPEVIEPVASSGNGTASASTAASTEPLGVAWGEKDSIGDLDAPPATSTFAQPEQKIYEVGGEVIAPRLVHRVEPAYPSILLRTRLRQTVEVRCVIDRNGRVRDPQIVSDSMPPFNQAVIAAVRQWRFTPGSLHGKAVETYLDLTVNFAVQ